MVVVEEEVLSFLEGLVEGFVNYQMTNTPLNLEKDQSTPINIEKEQKHPRYLEKDRYTPET